jgi:hypothetical protein
VGRIILTVAALGLAAQTAAAETRVFVIANSPDGYGVDRCLARGERCGALIANAYCQSQAFALAVSFRRVERDEVTASASTGADQNGMCRGACDEFIAIECKR